MLYIKYSDSPPGRRQGTRRGAINNNAANMPQLLQSMNAWCGHAPLPGLAVAMLHELLHACVCAGGRGGRHGSVEPFQTWRPAPTGPLPAACKNKHVQQRASIPCMPPGSHGVGTIVAGGATTLTARLLSEGHACPCYAHGSWREARLSQRAPRQRAGGGGAADLRCARVRATSRGWWPCARGSTWRSRSRCSSRRRR